MEKLSSTKLAPGAKKVGGRCPKTLSPQTKGLEQQTEMVPRKGANTARTCLSISCSLWLHIKLHCFLSAAGVETRHLQPSAIHPGFPQSTDRPAAFLVYTN